MRGGIVSIRISGKKTQILELVAEKAIKGLLKKAECRMVEYSGGFIGKHYEIYTKEYYKNNDNNASITFQVWNKREYKKITAR